MASIESKHRPNPDPASARETHGFQAEVRELLKLMIHSLYSHREIFLRELLSNASDACDRLRFAAIADGALLAEDRELAIRIDADPSAGTLTITDNGIGMTREEAIANLGTIARSGTAEFFRSLSGDEQKASQLIGQFGVGFYSAFIVAERVEVRSRSEEHTSELQSRLHLVCRLLLEKKQHVNHLLTYCRTLTTRIQLPPSIKD